jgi:hypothetical protein
MSIDLTHISFSRTMTLSPQLQGELILILELRLSQLCSEAFQKEPERLLRIENTLEIVNKLRNRDQIGWAEWVYRNYTVEFLKLKGVPTEQIPPAPAPYPSKHVIQANSI